MHPNGRLLERIATFYVPTDSEDMDNLRSCLDKVDLAFRLLDTMLVCYDDGAFPAQGGDEHVAYSRLATMADRYRSLRLPS